MAEIQELSIKITADGVSNSAKQINSLKNALSNLKTVIEDVSTAFKSVDVSGFDKVADACHKLSDIDATGMKDLADALKTISKVNISKIGKVASAMSGVATNGGAESSGIGQIAYNNHVDGEVVDRLRIGTSQNFSFGGEQSTNNLDVIDAKFKVIKDDVYASDNAMKAFQQTLIGMKQYTMQDFANMQSGTNSDSPQFLNQSNLPMVIQQVGEVAQEFNFANEKASNLETTLRRIGSIALNGITGSFKKFEGWLNKGNESLKNLWNSLKRIAMYRALRSAIKLVTDALKQGINNAYQWSKALGGEFSKNMDVLASSALTLKNSIGAALIPVINALTPVLTKAASAMTSLFNAMSRCIAILTGSSSWTKATDAVTEYAAATNKASKALAGFDEINNIGSSSKSSSSNVDYSNMFEEVPLDGTESKLQSILDLFDQLDAKIVGLVASLAALAAGLSPLKALGVGIIATGLVEFVQDLNEAIKDFTNGKFGEGIQDIIDCIGDLGTVLAGVGVLTGQGWLIVIGFSIKLLSVGLEWLLEPLTTMLDDLQNSETLEEKGKAVGKYIANHIINGFEEWLISVNPLIGGLATTIIEWFRPSNESVEEAYDDMDENGEYIYQGLVDGAEEENNSNKSFWQGLFKGIISIAKLVFGIHSPSTEFKDIGYNLIEGLKNGANGDKPSLLSSLTNIWNSIKTNASTGMANLKNTLSQKWNDIKSWWSNLSLDSFNIKLPHFNISTGSWGLPKISVDWYDKGTNFVAEDQLAMIHKGEAIVPSKYNQNPAYSPNGMGSEALYEVASLIIDAINDKDMNTYIDGNEIGKASVKYINKQSRLKGASIV